MSGTPSKFNAEDYRTAAKEHVTRSRELHDLGFYTLSHYVAGLAVECMLRAYYYRINQEFDARHDLRVLFRISRFSDRLREETVPAIAAALSDVATRWSNNHRYRSEDSLKRYLKNAGLDRGLPRNVNLVKASSLTIIEAATLLVTEGNVRWDSKRNPG